MRSALRALVMLLWVVSLSGCGPLETDGMDQVGRYVFHATEWGFEVREKPGPLQRLLEILLGRPVEPKLRVTETSAEGPGFAAQSIARVVTRKRVVRGPEAKSPFKGPWEVRLVDADEHELPPFFHFRYERQAESFANQLRIRLSSLRTGVDPHRGAGAQGPAPASAARDEASDRRDPAEEIPNE